MPRFLNTALTYGEMQKIVTNAKKELVLISPFLNIPPDFLERLKLAQKSVQITIVCRKRKLDAEEKNNLRQLQGLRLCFDENVHAKCFYNEESMVIGSLNLYEHSVQNNHEMGILLNIHEDTKVFNEAITEAEYIIESAEEDRFTSSKTNYRVSAPRQTYSAPVTKPEVKDDKSGSILKDIGNFISSALSDTEKGYCIRCGDRIKMGKPYCGDCYEKWAEFENHDYKERFCHTCGKDNASTMNKPLCRSCYKKSMA
jgi:hypothetical protein